MLLIDSRTFKGVHAIKYKKIKVKMWKRAKGIRQYVQYIPNDDSQNFKM